MFRSVALACVAVLLGTTYSQAGPVTFYPFGDGTNAIANFEGFDPTAGNILNVGGQTAILNWSPGNNQNFNAYGQAGITTVFAGGGSTGVNAGLTLVFGLTEQVTNVTGVPGTPNAVANFGIAPVGQQTANYFEVWAGASPDNLAGTGFNQGTRILAGTFTSVIGNPNVQVNQSNAGALDQFGPPQYPNSTAEIDGSFRLNGVINYYDPNYFGLAANETLIGAVTSFSTQLAAPFLSVNPSAAFLVNSTTTSVGESVVTSGAGLGIDFTSLGIGNVNGGVVGESGPSVQVQGDAQVTFAPIPVTTTTVPEPATLAVFGLMAGMGGLVYRKRRSVTLTA